MTVDELNVEVTRAILSAERLPSGAPEASAAWARVSAAEEALAEAHPAGTVEGDVARAGAVRAAARAGDSARARALSLRYGITVPLP